MYKSPINIEDLGTQMAERFDEEILNYSINVMQKYGITVKPYELIRALEYDRNQYEKGYQDGYQDGLKERQKGKWFDAHTCIRCTNCKSVFNRYVCDRQSYCGRNG